MNKRDKFRKMLLDDSYISWLSKTIKENDEDGIDNLYFKRQTNDENRYMLEFLDNLFLELFKYYVNKNDLPEHILNCFILKYDYDYEIYFTDEGVSCKKVNSDYYSNCPRINYFDLKKQYEKIKVYVKVKKKDKFKN